MGLSTHVLDTMHGSPAPGMVVELYAMDGPAPVLVKQFKLNADGRNPDGPLYDNANLRKGKYRLVFAVADYFRGRGVELPDPPFLDRSDEQSRREAGFVHGGTALHVIPRRPGAPAGVNCAALRARCAGRG